eukprot:3608788-Prymnesium_polylepis.2
MGAIGAHRARGRHKREAGAKRRVECVVDVELGHNLRAEYECVLRHPLCPIAPVVEKVEEELLPSGAKATLTPRAHTATLSPRTSGAGRAVQDDPAGRAGVGTLLVAEGIGARGGCGARVRCASGMRARGLISHISRRRQRVPQQRHEREDEGRHEGGALKVVGEEGLVPRRHAHHHARCRLVLLQAGDHPSERPQHEHAAPQVPVGVRVVWRQALVRRVGARDMPGLAAVEELCALEVAPRVTHVAHRAARQRVHVEHRSEAERLEPAQQSAQVDGATGHETLGRVAALFVARALLLERQVVAAWRLRAGRRLERPVAHRDAHVRDAGGRERNETRRRPLGTEQVVVDEGIPVRMHRRHRVDAAIAHPHDVVPFLVVGDAFGPEAEERDRREQPVLKDEPAAQIGSGGASHRVCAACDGQHAADAPRRGDGSSTRALLAATRSCLDRTRGPGLNKE